MANVAKSMIHKVNSCFCVKCVVDCLTHKWVIEMRTLGVHPYKVDAHCISTHEGNIGVSFSY